MSDKTLFGQLKIKLNELIKLIDQHELKNKPCAKQEINDENPNMVNCSCGVKILKSNFAKHEKTIRHQNFIKGVSSVSSNLEL
jgi:hypothetical protein